MKQISTWWDLFFLRSGTGYPGCTCIHLGWRCVVKAWRFSNYLHRPWKDTKTEFTQTHPPSSLFGYPSFVFLSTCKHKNILFLNLFFLQFSLNVWLNFFHRAFQYVQINSKLITDWIHRVTPPWGEDIRTAYTAAVTHPDKAKRNFVYD